MTTNNAQPGKGRPTVVTPEAIRKLEEAFAIGCSDKEACVYSGISLASLYRYQEDNEEFRERKDLLKEQPVMQARFTVVKAIKNDPDMAMKFLERKNKKEFSLRIENDIELTGKVEFANIVPRSNDK